MCFIYLYMHIFDIAFTVKFYDEFYDIAFLLVRSFIVWQNLAASSANLCLIIHQSNNTHKFYSLSSLSLAAFVQVCLLSLNVLPSLTGSMIRLIYC